MSGQLEENKMGVMPVKKLLFTMSLPAMISMIIQALYNIVDSIFVAMISEKALAAVTLVFPVQMLIISVGVGTGVGISSLIARRLGEKRFDEANASASHGFLLAFFSWIAFALFGLFLTKPFLGLFSDDAAILDDAVIYCMIITLGSIFIFIQINTEKMLQATGNMMFPMIFNIAGAVTNIILDPILIFGLLGAPKMGVAGAAIATIIGEFVGMALGLIMLFCFKHAVHVKIRGFKFNGGIVKDIYAVGVPSIVMQAIGSFAISGMNAILIQFSAAAVAVLGVYFRIQSLIFMPVFGLNQGTLPIIGYNYGARNKARLLEGYKTATLTAMCIMAVGTIVFNLFPVPILKLFSASPEMIHIGVKALSTISLCFVPAGFVIMASTLFQALGHGVLSLITSLMRQLFLIVPIAWLLARYFGVDYVWYAYPIAEVAAVILTVFFVRHIYIKEIKNL